MSTWHQQQAPSVPLWHVNKFTVVDDKSNKHTSIMTFETLDQAALHAAATGGYILYPQEGGRTT